MQKFHPVVFTTVGLPFFFDPSPPPSSDRLNIPWVFGYDYNFIVLCKLHRRAVGGWCYCSSDAKVLGMVLIVIGEHRAVIWDFWGITFPLSFHQVHNWHAILRFAGFHCRKLYLNPNIDYNDLQFIQENYPVHFFVSRNHKIQNIFLCI